MKKYQLMVFFLGLCCLTANAQTFTENDFQEFHALTGLWKMETSRGAIFEEWRLENNQKLSGRSFRLHDSDTVVMERIVLFLQDNAIIYSPAVSNQNDGQAVQFRLISHANSRYIFENKEHDFPQRIIYHLVSPDSVHARIEGTLNGKERGSDFRYRRVY